MGDVRTVGHKETPVTTNTRKNDEALTNFERTLINKGNVFAIAYYAIESLRTTDSLEEAYKKLSDIFENVDKANKDDLKKIFGFEVNNEKSNNE